MYEMAAPIQSPAKGQERSVIRFLNAKCERPAEIHKHLVAVCGNVMNRQNVTKKETSRWGKVRRRSHDFVQRASGRLL